MFIKLKLEPQSSTANSITNNFSNFFIDDDATVNTLKIKIEEYINIPAERQEIRTLTTTFQNNYQIKKVCDTKGSLVMLYDYGDYNEYQDPHFVCCLQLYTNEMAAKQQEIEKRLKLQTTPTSSSSSVTLIAVSDTEDSEGSGSETASSKSSCTDSETSGNSSDDNDSSGSKKRIKHGKQSTQHKKIKVATSVGGQYSPTLCQYLDEFPKCSKDIDTNNYPLETTSQVHNSQSVETKSPSTGLSISDIHNESTKIVRNYTNGVLPENNINSRPNVNSLKKIQSDIISTTHANIHPCYAINPEIREYVAIISRNDKNIISNTDCQELLVWFFDRFRACDASCNLQFDYQTAVSLYEGKLWIACMDVNTFEWISANILEYNLKPYSLLSLKETHHLCEVVLPIVSKSKNILEIFDLLEKQNKNLSTLKWCIRNRKIILPEEKCFKEKAISIFCTNELFQIVMDKESKEYLEHFNFKLKYCFWYIVFNFSCL